VSLPEFSVRRPVTVFMITVAVTIFGFLCAQMLPVELLPDLNYPSLTIQTVYPDAAPLSVEQFVTRPVEESVGVIPGVREMRSVSRAGLSEVILEFEWNEEMDFAAMDVREKLGLVELPRDAERPKVLRFDPSLDPIIRLAFRGDRALSDLRQIAERWIKPRLEAVKGVAAAKVRGGLDAEIQVEADEDRLAALGLTLDDLAQALRAENVNRPGGQLKRTVVRETPTGRVRVEDVARVTRGHRDRDEITRSEGTETVEIALHREGSANTVAVSAAVREELEELRGQMSEDVELIILTDQSRYISDAIGQVWSAAAIGGVLAVLVLFFFLRNPAATGIIAVTIPVSVIATFLPMYKAGVTLNIMSLGGLALGVGMLVDNSIVVLESIDRHRRLGRSRRRAAAEGGSEVAGAVTAATLTTVSVFVPIVFVRGVAGQLFYDLAITVCIALVASLIASLTLIPMLSALEFSKVERRSLEQVFGGAEARSSWPVVKELLRPRYVRPTLWGRATGKLTRALMLVSWPLRLIAHLAWYLLRAPILLLLLGLRGLIALALRAIVVVWWAISWAFHAVTWPAARALDALGRSYPATLAAAIRMRWAILPVAFALFVTAVAALPLLGTNLVPDLTQGEFAFRLQLKEGSTLESSAQVVGQIENRLTGDPRFAGIFSIIGSLPSTASGRRTMGENLAQINFVLPENAGTEDELRAVERVREILELFPSVEAELVRPSVLTVRPPVAVNIFSEDLDELDVAAAEVARQLWQVPGIDDVSMTSEPGNPEITIELDRERAAALGVQADALGRSLRRQIGGEIVGEFREEEERIDIRLRASAESRDRASEIEALRFRLDNGTAIPVSAVARVTLDRGPAAIYRAGGARVAQVLAMVASADLGRTLGAVRRMLGSVALPAGVLLELTGQDEELKVSFDSLKLALALAIFMVYVVMAVQFESLRYPFVILLAVPMGIVGVVAALLLTGTNISVLALIGAVMLAGIVVNNAIVLVDAIHRRRRAGEALEPAIVAAGRERLRPILMTTATTVLALLPLALGLGAGDELRRPLAITVIGGLTVATLLTLVIIPCLYRAFSRSEEQPEIATEPQPAMAGAPGPADGAAS